MIRYSALEARHQAAQRNTYNQCERKRAYTEPHRHEHLRTDYFRYCHTGTVPRRLAEISVQELHIKTSQLYRYRILEPFDLELMLNLVFSHLIKVVEVALDRHESEQAEHDRAYHEQRDK